MFDISLVRTSKTWRHCTGGKALGRVVREERYPRMD